MPTRVRLTARRTFRSLGVRNYRLYYVGQLVSLIGTWMETTGRSWLVYTITGSGVALGTVLALQFLPLLLFGMWGGVVADRFPKRRVLVASQSASGALALVLFVIVATGNPELWMIYALTFAQGCVTVVDHPTRQAFVTELVGPDEVANAVGLNAALFNTARLVGPAVGGLLIASIGIAPLFLVNAASFAAVIGALLALRIKELHVMASASAGKGQVREGLRYVWGHPVLRSTIALVTVIATFGFNYVIVLPLLADELGGGAPLFGLLLSLVAGGSLVGALVAASRARPTRSLLLGAGAAFGALSVVVAFAPTPALVGVALVCVGIATPLFISTANATLQLNSDPTMRGRVMALYVLVFLGSTPIGGPVVGWLADPANLGPRAGLAIGGGISLVAAVVAWITEREPRRALEWKVASAERSQQART